jgi:hypothetical protein
MSSKIDKISSKFRNGIYLYNICVFNFNVMISELFKRFAERSEKNQ